MSQPVPWRNLYRLADAFILHPPRPIPHVLRRTSPNYPVGHSDSFWVLGEDKLAYFRMQATIRAETPHLYLYVQDGLQISPAALAKAAQRFENHTYPTDRALYGSEWRPGVDGDPHITCLVGDLRSASTAGYFSAEDEYPPAVNPYSNAREMFYINSNNTLPGTPDFDFTLAHEFQHMIHFHVHPRDNAWMNEGMSMLAQRVNGYPDSVLGEVSSFLPDASTQLDTWGTGDNSNHYGASYLFLAYLYDHYGRALIHQILADKALADMPVISAALAQRHIPLTANQVFGDWAIANYLNDPSVAHGLYAYRDLPDKVSSIRSLSLPLTYHSTLPPYATRYIAVPNVAGHVPFTLSFHGSATVPLVGLPGTTPYWWSNRGDLMDTTLTRQVDLTHVAHPVLRYSAWYNIEKEYDYGYVEASTDGGKTWRTLPATHTSATNPTGANYGHGYTGDSHAWLNESVNLARYAGRRIDLRFEYITDDATNLQGLAIRNISIPGSRSTDPFAGWQARGFVPVQRNVLPDDWHVRLLETIGGRAQVRTLTLDPQKSGSITISPVKEGIKKLALVIYTTAPKTTVPTPFTLSGR